MVCVKRSNAPSNELFVLLSFSENEPDLCVQNAETNSPIAAMEAMNHAQNMRSKPHMVFGQ